MAVAVAVHGRLPSKLVHRRRRSKYNSPIITNQNRSITPPKPPLPPIFISTNPTHVNPHHLKELFTLCNHSCHRLPAIDPAGKVEPVNIVKLQIALSHSSVLVSVFTKQETIPSYSNSVGEIVPKLTGIGGEWIQKVIPVTPANGQLIGFGRAVSDFGLTASIYDVMWVTGFA